ncbi:MAG TPA: L-ribulose-5-phosphate 4-epimerase [Anaerolineales bacterium]|nr:L-ribulose-5-phosphate 4-epimerase [Anaerolineales bacterium]
MLPTLRTEVHRLHLELVRNQLVVWTMGNVSGRDPESGLVVIKPSGVRYDELNPEHLVVVDLDGKVIEGELKPSSDAAAHLYIYRHRQEVMGVVHTHSTFATAFAANNRPIPVYLTSMCDEFGGPIPCAGYAKVGGDEIGRQVIQSIGNSPAVLLKNHGVFAIGNSVEAAVKAAVMVEDAARTVFYALQLGSPDEIPAEEVLRAHRRYVEEYGQE